ncbi:MAG: cation-translocating P-type ATPase [Myxococcota bacterium]
MSARVAETGLFLDGLRCAGCALRVERELQSAPGVREAAVNFATQRALVRFDAGATDDAALVRRVEALGYRALPYDPAALERPASREARAILARLLVAAFLAGNVMVISLALYFGALGEIEPGVRRALRWLAVALSVPAVSWCAGPFWRGAIRGLRRRELTLDVPVVLGVSTAFAASILGTLAETHDVYMDSASMIVFLILLGRTLERGARARASGAVERLVARAPRRALRRGPDGLEEVDAAALVAGDRVVVPAGQAFPTDARLLTAVAELDESLLTGESLPVTRRAGEAVASGTRNLAGEVEVEVSAPASAGTVARLAGLLERAQAQRPGIQRAVDRVASVFAPVVLGVAGATALGWALAGASLHDVALRAAAVLIVACPCALGLATPAAVAAALGRAAQLGFLFKSGEALERAARIDRVILDKTGTLTEGRLEVVRVAATCGVPDARLLEAAASAVGQSRHPVAAGIRREAELRGLAFELENESRTLPGLGVEAGKRLVGSRALLEAHDVALPSELERAADAEARAGASLAFVAENGVALGVLVLADLPRADAREAVQRLVSLGLRPALLSGDHEGAALRAAERAGLVEVQSDARPDAKLARVQSERASGACVLLAGDGINDAAALAAADLGVAFAQGSDVTIHAADVVIHAPRLMALPALVELARVAMRRIRENLLVAIAYNAIAVPLAIAGLLGPLSAAIAMSLSSLVVTGNSLRLLRFRMRP